MTDQAPPPPPVSVAMKGGTPIIIGRANYIYWSGFERLGRMGTALK